MSARIAQVVRALRKHLYRRHFGTLTSVRTHAPFAALTFDDGPHPQSTPAILALLDRHQAKATFFIVGQRAERYPELLHRIMDAGHELANHTYDHASLPLLKPDQIAGQLAQAQVRIGPGASRWFRPPFGHQTLATQRLVRLSGYRSVAWSVAAEDWAIDTPEQIAHRVLANLRPGAIVLMHDYLYHCDQDPALADRVASLRALDMILQADNGIRFLTLSELIRVGKPIYTNWMFPPNKAMLARLILPDTDV